MNRDAAARHTRPSAVGRRPRLGVSIGPSPARAAALLGVVASVVALYGLTTTPAFQVQRIDVSPLSWTSRDQVVQELGVQPGTNAFQLGTSDLVARIEQLPAVASASVAIGLPGTLVVGVTERVPILAWRVGEVTFLVDRTGRLFATAGQGATDTSTLPTIVDLRAASKASLAIGASLDPTDLDAATRLASLKPLDIGSRATALGVEITDGDGFLLATTPGSWNAVFGPYSAVLRSPELIPGQVRLLRSILSGQETRLARIVLADAEHGSVVPLPSGH